MSSTTGYLQRGGHGWSVADKASRLLWAISKQCSRSWRDSEAERAGKVLLSGLLSAHCRAFEEDEQAKAGESQ